MPVTKVNPVRGTIVWRERAGAQAGVEQFISWKESRWTQGGAKGCHLSRLELRKVPLVETGVGSIAGNLLHSGWSPAPWGNSANLDTGSISGPRCSGESPGGFARARSLAVLVCLSVCPHRRRSRTRQQDPAGGARRCGPALRARRTPNAPRLRPLAPRGRDFPSLRPPSLTSPLCLPESRAGRWGRKGVSARLASGAPPHPGRPGIPERAPGAHPQRDQTAAPCAPQPVRRVHSKRGRTAASRGPAPPPAPI